MSGFVVLSHEQSVHNYECFYRSQNNISPIQITNCMYFVVSSAKNGRKESKSPGRVYDKPNNVLR